MKLINLVYLLILYFFKTIQILGCCDRNEIDAAIKVSVSLTYLIFKFLISFLRLVYNARTQSAMPKQIAPYFQSENPTFFLESLSLQNVFPIRLSTHFDATKYRGETVLVLSSYHSPPFSSKSTWNLQDLWIYKP